MTKAQHQLLVSVALIVMASASGEDRRTLERAINALEADDELSRMAKEHEIMRGALLDIRGFHVPDQPASSQADEVSWVMQHVGRLRGIAANALDTKEPRS